MGEKQNQPFQLSFDSSLKVDFQGSRVTSDGGLILVRELDGHLASLTRLQQRLLGTSGWWVKHARYYWLLLEERHLTRRLFGAMPCSIAALSSPAG
jgi:hypothetical protein